MAARSLVGLPLGLTGGGGAIFAVPLLVYWIGVEPRTAVSISLVTVAVAMQVTAGRSIPLHIAGSFVVGGVPALFAGSWVGRRIGGPTLARVFSVAIVAVAAFIIVKTLAGRCVRFAP